MLDRSIITCGHNAGAYAIGAGMLGPVTREDGMRIEPIGRTVLAMGVLSIGFLVATASPARSEDGTIVLGAALSETGKFAVSGLHTKDGNDFAVDRVNAMGDVKVGDKFYKLETKYYDDESETARAAEPTERLVGQDDIQYILGPMAPQ